jgi:hypothetical protein
MAVSYKDVRNNRQWKATIGLSEESFHELSTAFGTAYERFHELGIERLAASRKQPLLLPTYKDALFFALFQLKNGLTQDCLGALFGMDGVTACYHFHKYVEVLELALRDKGALPRQRFGSVKEFENSLKGRRQITVDATECGLQRPKDKEKQKQYYSGKKKAYL